MQYYTKERIGLVMSVFLLLYQFFLQFLADPLAGLKGPIPFCPLFSGIAGEVVIQEGWPQRTVTRNHWRSHGWARVGTCPPYLGQGGS